MQGKTIQQGNLCRACVYVGLRLILPLWSNKFREIVISDP